MSKNPSPQRRRPAIEGVAVEFVNSSSMVAGLTLTRPGDRPCGALPVALHSYRHEQRDAGALPILSIALLLINSVEWCYQLAMNPIRLNPFQNTEATNMHCGAHN